MDLQVTVKKRVLETASLLKLPYLLQELGNVTHCSFLKQYVVAHGSNLARYKIQAGDFFR